MLPDGMTHRGKWANRRGHLSLLKKPHPHPLSEWNNPTQPPPRGGVPNESWLGKGILNTKRAFLRCEETPFSLQGNALFVLKGAFLSLKIMPHCRDRRPRLETPPSLPQGEEHLMITYLNGSFYPKGCHRVGTDAFVCPSKHS